MLMAVDVGNTNCVFAIFDGDKLLHCWRARTDAQRSCDEYKAWLYTMMNQARCPLDSITGYALASVAPAMTEKLMRLGHELFGAAQCWCLGSERMPIPIKAKIDQPSQAGADRLINAFQAYRVYQCPLIAVDFGTATSFDVVDHYGDFIGGVIAPGVNLSLEALYNAAKHLPRVDVAQPPAVLGKNSKDAIQSGLFWGYVGMIDGVIARLKDELRSIIGEHSPIPVIATGGLAQKFTPACQQIQDYNPDLTLEGIKSVYDHWHNQPSFKETYYKDNKNA